MGSSVPTAPPDHGPLPGADRGQGVGAAGPGEVRHCRHRFLLQSVQGEDACMVAWRLNSQFYLKVTCVSHDFNCSLALCGTLGKKKKRELHRNSPVPPDWKKSAYFTGQWELWEQGRLKVMEVNLAELVD